MANDQFPWLTPFSQLDAPGFAWRTGGHRGNTETPTHVATTETPRHEGNHEARLPAPKRRGAEAQSPPTPPPALREKGEGVVVKDLERVPGVHAAEGVYISRCGQRRPCLAMMNR